MYLIINVHFNQKSCMEFYYYDSVNTICTHISAYVENVN